ncbi:flagellar basal body L-ring protein FlgH [Novosphingobium flavum]|uniref:flagellar basal body L-ring protein FlgH n=1 Tax=Novosphingobium flavum TaxID=1778672 RepID=UPI001FE49721|nr:flagellar basal body L-ring protein FlgH [Novosphingobium flavum]
MTKTMGQRVAFDRFSLSGVGIVGLVALAVGSAPALARKPPVGFEAAQPMAAPVLRPATGGIFDAGLGYAGLVQGNVARRVGDPVTILLIENTTTAKTAGSKTSRNGGFSLTPPTSGPLGFLNPDALNASGQSSFKGDGSAAQTSSFSGTVGVTIAEVRPNGTALVKGEKRLLLSQGQEWIQFSGIVRLADIDPQTNSVTSAKVADARMEYAGNGSIQRAGREGWLSRFFNMISPF